MENTIPLLRRKSSGVSILAIAISIFLSTDIRAQVVASFEIDEPEGCTPHAVTFANNSTSGSGDPMNYYWHFGDETNSTAENPSKTYNSGADFTVKLVVTNANNPDDKDSVSKVVSVIATPAATLDISSQYACVNELITFVFSGAIKDSLYLDFGDGTISKQISSPITHKYKAHGNYDIKFYTYYKNCFDTNTTKNIVVDGPIADYSISKDSACIGEEIVFALGPNQIGVDSTLWMLDDGTTSKEDTLRYVYESWGNYLPLLRVYSSKNCDLAEPLHVYNVVAGFTWENDALCAERYVYFKNESFGNDINNWNFGTGDVSSDKSPQYIFQMGEQIVKLDVSNDAGCSDSFTDTLFVNDIPDITLDEEYWFVCEGESAKLGASGGDSIAWVPSDFLDNTESYNPVATPPYTVDYQVYVYDTSTKCPSFGTIRVEVQNVPKWNIEIAPLIDTLIVGETDTIKFNLNGNFVYTWESDDTIQYYNDSLLVVQPVLARDENATYYLTVLDSNGCFNYEESVDIFVREEYSIGLPKAFSPNGDNINDDIKINGWGIREVIEFRIYNRSGTQVFFSDDVNTGWDGTRNGKPQPIDTYAFTFKVVMWDDRIIEKNGTFSLIR
jgi:gliding motility-associated-like protein